MKKDPKVFLIHILESICLIEEYAKNATSAKFRKNRALQDAVIRRPEIIGEAVKNLSPSFRFFPNKTLRNSLETNGRNERYFNSRIF